MKLPDLKQKTPADLISEAEKLGIENPSTLRKQDIICNIKNSQKKMSKSVHQEF